MKVLFNRRVRRVFEIVRVYQQREFFSFKDGGLDLGSNETKLTLVTRDIHFSGNQVKPYIKEL